MPIINLTVDGKRTIKDSDSIDTKIVCLNKDYKVHITLKNCDTFVGLEYKKLVVKYGMEYSETSLKQETVNGKTVYTADMPAVKNAQNVEIGVCGRLVASSSTEPVFTSTPAIFECEKSVLCGAAVLNTDPVLIEKTFDTSGSYPASDYDADGFYRVNVKVGSIQTEIRMVDLDMLTGDQVVNPTTYDRKMSKVVVRKPVSLVPANIRKGITIGNVKGLYEPVLTEGTFTSSGEYPVPEGFEGYSKVIVNVANTGGEKPTAVLKITTQNMSNYVGKDIDISGYGVLRIEFDDFEDSL
jgi:hypothetical protein